MWRSCRACEEEQYVNSCERRLDVVSHVMNSRQGWVWGTRRQKTQIEQRHRICLKYLTGKPITVFLAHSCNEKLGQWKVMNVTKVMSESASNNISLKLSIEDIILLMEKKAFWKMLTFPRHQWNYEFSVAENFPQDYKWRWIILDFGEDRNLLILETRVWLTLRICEAAQRGAGQDTKQWQECDNPLTQWPSTGQGLRTHFWPWSGRALWTWDWWSPRAWPPGSHLGSCRHC